MAAASSSASPDGAVNPYLLPAVLLAAGLDGVAAKRDPGPPLMIDMYTQRPARRVRTLPLNLLDALRALEAAKSLRAQLGEPFVSAYLKLRHADWNSYTRHLTQWERETTLDC